MSVRLLGLRQEVGQALYQGDFAFAGLRRCVVGYAHVGFCRLAEHRADAGICVLDEWPCVAVEVN